MTFRIWTILWIFALFASALSTFGGAGLWIAFVVLSFWTLVYNYRKLSASAWLVLFAVVLALLALLLPSVQAVRETARRNSCINNMKQILLAMHNYHDRKGTFPPPYSIAANGKKLLSWRCQTLPELESSTLYRRLQLNESWDSPLNAALLTQAKSINVYQCPTHPTTSSAAHYLAVVDERSAWHPARGRALREFKDGASNTILLIEAPQQRIPWAKPADLSWDEAVEMLTNPDPAEWGHENSRGFFYQPTRAIHAGFADGSVQSLELPLSKAHAMALLTVAGGEDLASHQFRHAPKLKLDYARIYSLSVLVLVSLLPAFQGGRRVDAPPIIEND